jgi:nitroimidazol reductase NimA-like FMN-containing flavoprotein (pyridoxamine 5'-phosphate oxidase superfamily)
MSLENQPAKAMPHQELENYISQFLSEKNMCVLATCYEDIPRATPIEYRSKGNKLYFVGEPGTKLKNLANNQNVSIGIYLPYVGWESAKGVQITGKATIISRRSGEFNESLEAYQWEKTAKEFNLREFPESLTLIRVDPSKVELIDMSLKKKGYSSRQVLVIKENKGCL